LNGGWLDRGRRGRRILKAVTVAVAIGLILELAQFLLPPRVPSITDVACFALGGAIGAWGEIPTVFRREAH